MTGASEIVLLKEASELPPRRWHSVRMAYLEVQAAVRRFAVGTKPNASMVRMITALAALAALTTAGVVPVSWFVAAKARLEGEV